MRKASRFMPKNQAGELSWLNRVSIAVFFGGLITMLALIVINEPIVLLVIAIVGLITSYNWENIEKPRIEKHFSSLKEERRNLSICNFAREFDTKTIDTWIIRAVYEEVQSELFTQHKIPMKASDKLYDTLLLDEDDLDLSLAGKIAERCGRSFDDYENNPYCGEVTTVGNLVLFFNHQPLLNNRMLE